MLQPDPADDNLSNTKIREKYADHLHPGQVGEYAINNRLSERALIEAEQLGGLTIDRAILDRNDKTLILSFHGGKYIAIEPLPGYDNDIELCFDRVKARQLLEDFNRDDVLASGLLSEGDIAAIENEWREAEEKKRRNRERDERATYERLKAKYG